MDFWDMVGGDGECPRDRSLESRVLDIDPPFSDRLGVGKTSEKLREFQLCQLCQQ